MKKQFTKKVKKKKITHNIKITRQFITINEYYYKKKNSPNALKGYIIHNNFWGWVMKFEALLTYLRHVSVLPLILFYQDIFSFGMLEV